MRVNSKCLWAIALVSVMAVSVHAEFRTWTDINGIKLDAEYVKISGDQVYLKDREGKETQVSRDYLCDKDILYVDLKNPPRVTINVNADVMRRSIAAHRNTQVKRESVQCKVTITKSSPMPYSADLRAKVYTIGKRVHFDDYVLMDKTTSTFAFDLEGNRHLKHEFSGERIDLTKAQGGGKVGGAYEGYLVVVMDQNRNVIEVKANRTIFSDNYEAIMNYKKLTIFDKDFGKSKKKADPKGMPGPGFGRRRW